MYRSLIEDLVILSAEYIKISENILKYLSLTLALKLDSYLERLRQLVVFRNLIVNIMYLSFKIVLKIANVYMKRIFISQV